MSFFYVKNKLTLLVDTLRIIILFNIVLDFQLHKDTYFFFLSNNKLQKNNENCKKCNLTRQKMPPK